MNKELKKSKTQPEANTQDDSVKANLLEGELSDQDLDAVSGGIRSKRKS